MKTGWKTIAIALFAYGTLHGAPRYELSDGSGVRGETIAISLRLSHEEAIRGFSFALRFETAALEFAGAELGIATVTIGEMFLFASGTGSTPEGAVVGGCVFDVEEPFALQVLDPGDAQEVAALAMRIREDAPFGSSPVVLGEEPGPHGVPVGNLVATLDGQEVEVEAVDGTVRVAPRAPSLLSCARAEEDPASVVLRWANTEPDLEAVRIYREGTRIETLPGSAEVYIDERAGPAASHYAVEPVGGGEAGEAGSCDAAPVGRFIRADVNADGSINIADPIEALNFLFGGARVDCKDAVDINDNGVLEIGDPIYALNYMFMDGPAPPPPFPAPGYDRTPDPLGCERT